MRNVYGCALLSLLTILSGCAKRNTATPSVAEISNEEALAFENYLLTKSGAGPKKEQWIHIQPVNKKEPCKLLTDKEIIEDNNVNVYWDGQCKNGFAYGLGRDISISDTFHRETITIHDGTGSQEAAPVVGYDYISNIVVYGVISQDPAKPSEHNFSVTGQKFTNNTNGFEIQYSNIYQDRDGSQLISMWNQFDPKRVSIKQNDKIKYIFTDMRNVPSTISDSMIFSVVTVDPVTNSLGDGAVAFVDYRNGTARHFRMQSGQVVDIKLPDSYIAHMMIQYRQVTDAQTLIGNAARRAKEMEDRYRYMACNGKHKIAGLDKDISSKYCTWRDQFRESYERQVAKIKQNTEQMQLAEQQRQVSAQQQQQQIYAYQQAQQQAQYEQQMRDAEALNSLADATLQLGGQALQGGLGLMNTMQLQQQNNLSQQQLQQQKRLNNYILRNR